MMGFPPPRAQNSLSSHSVGDSHPQDSVNEKQPSVATQVCGKGLESCLLWWERHARVVCQGTMPYPCVESGHVCNLDFRIILHLPIFNFSSPMPPPHPVWQGLLSWRCVVWDPWSCDHPHPNGAWLWLTLLPWGKHVPGLLTLQFKPHLSPKG